MEAAGNNGTLTSTRKKTQCHNPKLRAIQ